MLSKIKQYMLEDHYFSPPDLLALLIILCVIGGVVGWVYEVVFYWLNGGCRLWYWRGSTFAPWIDIYGLGVLLILIFTWKVRRSPWKVILISGVTCGLLEYIVGLLMFYLGNGHRAWNYNTEILNFGNIQGFICLRSVLVFAFAGGAFMLCIYPLIAHQFSVSSENTMKIVRTISYIVGFFLLLDILYNDILVYLIPSLPSAGHLYEKYLHFNFVQFTKGQLYG